jgi:hypothetical protein
VEVKTLFGDIREGAEAENPGVVDQDVESIANPVTCTLSTTKDQDFKLSWLRHE